MKTKSKINPPIIYQIEDSREALKKLEGELTNTEKEPEKSIILDYPIVYIHNYSETNQYETTASSMTGDSV